MSPTLKQGQIVIAKKSKNYQVGQIVIAKQGKKEVIKRVTAVNDGRYNLLGDNLGGSTDSRTKGPVSYQEILGKVILTI